MRWAAPSARAGTRSDRDHTCCVQGFGISYAVQATVGTPPQPFRIILDTGSSDFWLSSAGCQGCPPSAPAFDPSSSNSFQVPSDSSEQINILYDSGKVAGMLGADTVSLAGLTAPAQALLVADEVSIDFLGDELGVSGLMGLAFPPLAATGATPFWQALIARGALDQPAMAFWLAPADRTSGHSEQPGGEFTLGGVNETLFSGDIEYNDLSDGQTASWWLLEMSSES
jgi:cathepsin D